MLNPDQIIASAEQPMRNFCKSFQEIIGDWKPFLRATEKILKGEDVGNDAVQPEMQFLVDWSKLIMDVTRQGQWDWSRPDVQALFKTYAESRMYKIFADAMIDMVVAIAKAGQIGTVVEIGTGPGKVTEVLCREMVKNGISVPVIISDSAPGIKSVGRRLQNEYPGLLIADFVWDITQDPPRELITRLQRPVIMYERFCIPYGGYETIDRIASVADILLLLEDFNLTEKKEAYDIIFEKIGLQFFTYQKTREYLEKHFQFVHPFKDTGAINLTDTCFFLLAMKQIAPGMARAVKPV